MDDVWLLLQNVMTIIMDMAVNIGDVIIIHVITEASVRRRSQGRAIIATASVHTLEVIVRHRFVNVSS